MLIFLDHLSTDQRHRSLQQSISLQEGNLACIQDAVDLERAEFTRQTVETVSTFSWA